MAEREQWNPILQGQWGLVKLSAFASLLVLALPNLALAGIDLDQYRSIFGERVLVFSDDMDRDDMQRVLTELHENQGGREFSDQRYALLFKPGTYELTVTVDYYVQALGLGKTPDETVIHGAVQSIHVKADNKVTTEFWRGAENFKVYTDTTERWMYWAVSQAAPMRRMHIVGNVNFDKHGWASGGVLANSVVTGRAD